MRSCGSLLLIVALAGCPGSSTPVNGEPMYTDGGCQVGCERCPVNTLCVSLPYQSVCLQKCSKPSDCPTGETCALLKNEVVPSCVTSDRPVWCTPQPCNIQPKCKDSKTLLVPLDYTDLVCGWAVMPCPTNSSCDPTTAQCK